MKVSVALLVASAASASGFGVAPAFTARAQARTSVILEASRKAQKIASRSAWAGARGVGGGGAVAEASEAGLMTNDEGLEYVKLVHPNGSSSEVYLFGGDVTSYKDPDGVEYIAVRPDAKMDGSKPISGGLSHCWPQFGPGEIQQHGFARNVN
jgi:glucose-6-phosphate 1-epimerase